jgi:hypothetical protein
LIWEGQVPGTLGFDKSLLILNGKFNKNCVRRQEEGDKKGTQKRKKEDVGFEIIIL